MANMETNADILLSIVDLNRSKAHLLEQMRNLELANQTENLAQLIDVYELICGTINQKLKRIDFRRKVELSNVLVDLNQSLCESNMAFEVDLCAMLKGSEHERIIFRTLFDLWNGEIPLEFYESFGRIENDFIQMLSHLGIQIEEETMPYEDVKTINQYIQTIYFVIESNLRQPGLSPKVKKELLQLKYNAIFLFDVIEERQLMIRFSPSKEPALTDQTSIETTGISLKKYLKHLDNTMMVLLNEACSKFNNEDTNLNMLDKIRLQSCVVLLSNKKTVLNVLHDSSIWDTIQTFSSDEYQYQRKYLKILKYIKCLFSIILFSMKTCYNEYGEMIWQK